jgi:O-antigen/teichoic acid export membrane protein
VYIVSAFHSATIITPVQVFADEKIQSGSREYFNAMMTLQLVVVVVLCLLAATLGLIVAPYVFDQAYLFTVVPALTAAYVMSEYFRKLFFVLEESYKAVLLDAMRFGTLIVGATWYLFLDPVDPLTGVFALAIAANMVSAAYGWLTSGSALSRDFAYVRTIGLESWRYSRWLIPLVITQRSGPDLVYGVAGSLLGLGALGGLRAMHQLLNASNIYLAMLQNVVPGAMSRRLNRDGADGLSRELACLLLISCGVSLSLLILAGFDSKWLVTFIFGEEFAVFSGALPIMAFGFAALMVSYPIAGTLLAFRDSRGIAAANFAGAVVCLITVYPLTLFFGVEGSAWAFSSYFVVEAAVVAIMSYRCFGEARRTTAGA